MSKNLLRRNLDKWWIRLRRFLMKNAKNLALNVIIDIFGLSMTSIENCSQCNQSVVEMGAWNKT